MKILDKMGKKEAALKVAKKAVYLFCFFSIIAIIYGTIVVGVECAFGKWAKIAFQTSYIIVGLIYLAYCLVRDEKK